MKQSEVYKIKTGWIMLFGLFCLAFLCLSRNNSIKQESVITTIHFNADRLQHNVSLPAHYALVNVQVPVAVTVQSAENQMQGLLNLSFQQSKRDDILLKILHDHCFIQKTILPCIRSVCSSSQDDPAGLS